MDEQHGPRGGSRRTDSESAQRLVAYHKELKSRRNTLEEILGARLFPWVIICVCVSYFLYQLFGATLLYYAIPLTIVLQVLVFLFELSQNQKRPLASHPPED